MKILVTGGAGYLGSVLLPKLLDRGHQVRVLDQAYFGQDSLKALHSKIEFIRKDIRLLEYDPKWRDTLLEDCDSVIHLAAISNDPSADLDAGLTREINCRATEILAEAARKRKIKFLFSSSCSIYGYHPSGDEIDEEGELHPLTTYAVSKVLAEKSLLQMKDRTWSPVILRNGTLFGYSPRMRFDLVVNIFSMMSALYNEIKVFGQGLEWRPFLHVEDCAEAFVFLIEKRELRHSSYNIVHQNLRVADLIPIFQWINPNLQLRWVEKGSEDRRDYRVSTVRMRQEGFKTKRDIESGARKICEAIARGLISDPESIYHQNAKWMKELMLNGKLKTGAK